MTHASLTSSICFRLTRRCNALCDFCQAPSLREADLSRESISRILQWLRDNGVTGVKFTGGEPTVRADLPSILHESAKMGFANTLCTNAIVLSTEVLQSILDTATKVKISLHGHEDLHDQLLGRKCYASVLGNLEALCSRGASVSVHMTVVKSNIDLIEDMLHFCIDRGIRKISYIPFVPRGRGLGYRETFELSDVELQGVREAVAGMKEAYRSMIDVRLLDFWEKEYFVIEADGMLSIQRETDSSDTKLKLLGV